MSSRIDKILAIGEADDAWVRAQVKAAVEEWFTHISLDDLFMAKGWQAPRTVERADDSWTENE